MSLAAPTSSEERPAPHLPAPWGLTEIALTVALTVALLLVASLVAAVVVALLDLGQEISDDAGTAAILLTSQLVIDIGAVAIAAAFSIRRYKLSPMAWRITWPPHIRWGSVMATVGLSFGALWTYTLITVALGLDNLRPENNVPTDLFEDNRVLPLTLLLVLVAAPVCEELYFRGFLFHGFWTGFQRLWARLRMSASFQARWASWGFWPGAVANGLFFSLIHVTELRLVGLIIPFTVIGVLFARLVLRTGSIWNAIVAHFLFNLVGVVGTLAGRAAS